MAILGCNWPNTSPRLLSVQYLEDMHKRKVLLYYGRVQRQIYLAAKFTMGFYAAFKMPSRKLDFWCFKRKK